MVLVRSVAVLIPNLFLRIMPSAPKLQNVALLGIKATILKHKDVSSGMFLEASVRKPG